MSDKNTVNERDTFKMRIKKTVLLAIVGAVIILSGCTTVVDKSVRTTGGDSNVDMQANTGNDKLTDIAELTFNTQLLQYLDMTYSQFKEEVGTEAEFYHGLYFQAPISGKDADAVFQGNYDDEVAGSVLSDEDKSFRVESSLSNIINGITKEMTVTETLLLIYS